MQTLGRVVAALSVVALLAGGGVAGVGSRVRRIKLRPAAGQSVQHGAGGVRLRESARGAVIEVNVRGLQRASSYDVRGGADGRALGRITTDRRGRGRLRLTARCDGGDGAAAGFRSIEVVDTATDDCVLEGRWRPIWDFVAIGAGGYGEYGSPTATAILGSFASDGEEGLSVQFYVPIDPVLPQAGEVGYGVSVENAELPFGATHAAELQGLPFEVVDLDGDVLVNGSLPQMCAPRWMPVWWPPAGDASAGRAKSGIVPEEPEYFLRIYVARARDPEILPLRFLWRVEF